MGIADVIEAFILRKLSDGTQNAIILRRNEMAEEISCAPSQISYVLSTRFTLERGFEVESRRGSGGFVRIARREHQTKIYESLLRRITDDISYEETIDLVEILLVAGLITGREGVLIRNFVTNIYETIGPQQRVVLLRSIIMTLAELP